MIQLTDNAVSAIKTALARAAENAGPDARTAEGLRIMVQTGGCAGFKYMMGLEVQTRDGDELVRQDGVTLFIDSESQPHVAGMTVDFVSGLESSGFVLETRTPRRSAPAASPSPDLRPSRRPIMFEAASSEAPMFDDEPASPLPGACVSSTCSAVRGRRHAETFRPRLRAPVRRAPSTGPSIWRRSRPRWPSSARACRPTAATASSGGSPTSSGCG